MYLSQLRWLEGFAAGGRWYVVGSASAETTPDGLALSQAQRIVNRLRRDHGDVLEALVGDVEAWSAAIDGVLRRLRGQVRQGSAPVEMVDLAPPRVQKAARALEAAHPALRALVRAAASAWALRPEVLARAIVWMKTRSHSLARLADGAEPGELRRLLELALIATKSEAGVDALLTLMLTDVPHPDAAVARVDNLIGRLKSSDTAVAPVPKRSTTMVVAWADELLRWPPADRIRALTLLAEADLAAWFRRWSAWEGEHGARIERALAFADRGIERGPTIERVREILSGVETAKAAWPASIALDEIWSGITLLAQERCLPFYRALMRLLAALPSLEAGSERLMFLRHAAAVANGADGDCRAAWLWEGVALELEGGAPERVLGPWRSIFRGKRRPWLEKDMLMDVRQPVQVRRLAAALARLARDLPVGGWHARQLGCAVAGGLNVDEAAALIHLLASLEIELSGPLVRAAVALVGRDAGALFQPLRFMCDRASSLGKAGEEALAELCEHAAATGGAWLLRELVHHDRPRLVELAGLARLVPRRQWPKLEIDSARPRWIEAYPAPLAEALARLARVDPEAEESARRRLATDLPDRGALQREVAALRARAPLDDRQARRLSNLEARMAAPRLPSAVRLGRLAAKLNAAALSVGVARAIAVLTAAAQAHVLEALGLEAWPGGAVDATHWAVLRGLAGLDPPDRALAGRLLRSRAGPRPWDLRDDPANRAFLGRLRRLGLDPTPWLDDTPRMIAAGDGQPLELGLCGDPLEVLAMGAYFNTCLAPDGGNFFSAITNAADVNKRVLYGRRGGRVVGRCLFALTDGGHVVTFHPYAHDRRLAFAALVHDFAVDLAARMGSQVAPSGRVSQLLGRDWYDDGTRDLVGRYEALGSPPFLAAIALVAPSGLVALLEATLARPLDDVTLPVVLAAPGLSARPELIEPLAPYLLSCPTLPDDSLVTAARLASRHGDQALADRLLASPAARADLEHDAWELGQVLARTRPSLALARLRQTRPRHVRGWDDETGERLAVAGLAMETLRRPRQAAVLYRRAMAEETWLADELGPRLAAVARL